MPIILISPYSKYFGEGKENAKNYPYWQELINLLKKEKYKIYQIGVKGEKELMNIDKYIFNKPFKKLKNYLKICDFYISVDNFFQHFAHYYGKYGFVIYGKSDPELFGYKENINIFKSKDYLRKGQYLYWKEEPYNKEVFVNPTIVYKIILKNRGTVCSRQILK